ncbi:MAG: CDP-diacylglycerol--glycerol-3-phosphate 3-phosphatidyltransferase [Mycoplasmataceae bacterium]|nr:CDP-diacylglycerol--glycerol-3-phosphate 3-phosphatidyltransferase [Mycoplasmataceae bacterium]
MSILQRRLIPNYLTFSRIFAAIVVIIFLSLDSQIVLFEFTFMGQVYIFHTNYVFAGAVFLVGTVTDYLDGSLARRYSWISVVGKIWDPVTDKILVNSTVIMLGYLNVVPIWVSIIFIFRDTIVESYRMSVAQHGIVVPANILGKLKTVFQMVGIIVVFFMLNSGDDSQWEYWVLQNGFMLLAVIFSVVSGSYYIYEISKKINESITPKLIYGKTSKAAVSTKSAVSAKTNKKPVSPKTVPVAKANKKVISTKNTHKTKKSAH